MWFSCHYWTIKLMIESYYLFCVAPCNIGFYKDVCDNISICGKGYLWILNNFQFCKSEQPLDPLVLCRKVFERVSV